MIAPSIRQSVPQGRPRRGSSPRRALLLLALTGLISGCSTDAPPGSNGVSGDTAPTTAEIVVTAAPEVDAMPKSGTAPGVGGPVRSMAGHFEVRYAADSDPILVNTMHSWVISLRRPDGASVEDARITVSGDMPAHGHGMPTQPEMTEALGGGDYRIEGMKFQMAGAWEVYLDIVDAAGLADRVVLPLRFE